MKNVTNVIKTSFLSLLLSLLPLIGAKAQIFAQGEVVTYEPSTMLANCTLPIFPGSKGLFDTTDVRKYIDKANDGNGVSDGLSEGEMFEYEGLWYMVTYEPQKVAVVSNPDGKTFYEGDIIIPESVTYKGVTYSVTVLYGSCFAGCTNLLSVSIPKSVEYIGWKGFATSIGKFISHQDSFSDCINLERIDVSPDNSYYCSKDGVLYNKDMRILERYPAAKEDPDFMMPKEVDSLRLDCFYNSSKLKNIRVDAESKSWSSVDGILYNKAKTIMCIYPPGRLDSHYDIPLEVDTIGISCFSYCNNLRTVGIHKDVKSIGINIVQTTMGTFIMGGKSFNNCRNLIDINVDPNNQYYASEDGVLFDKEKTELITYPMGKQDSRYSIPEGTQKFVSAFTDCKYLQTLIFPSSLNSIGETVITSMGTFSIPAPHFLQCNSLKSIEVDANNQIYSSDNGVLYSKDKSMLVYYPGGRSGSKYKVADGTSKLMHYCFSESSQLKTVIIPETVTTFDIYAFYGCPRIEEIVNLSSTPQTIDNDIFANYGTLYVPNGSKSDFENDSIWSNFSPIYELEDNSIVDSWGETGTCIWYITSENELVIAPADGVSGDLLEEEWEGSNSDDKGNHFTTAPWGEYYESILTVKVMEGVNAKSGACMFYGLSQMTSADLSGLNTEEVTSMYGMFYDCSSLTSLDLRSFDTHNVKDMFYMFGYCSSLTSIDLSSFDTHNVTYMNSMFGNCSSLTSLDLSNFDTRNVESMWWIFWNCSSLTTLNLTNFNTENMDLRDEFGSCSSLTTIISNREIPSVLKAGTFSKSFENRANCTLIVPAGTKALYEAADGWNELGNIEERTPEDSHGTQILALTSDEYFYNSEEYTAQTVTYTRNFSKETVLHTSAGWESIVLPFNVEGIITESGQVLAPFGSILANTGAALPFWLAEYHADGYAFATSIRANVPYIICMPNGEDTNKKYRISGNVTFYAHNTAVHASNELQSVEGNDGFTFTPTYDFVEASETVFAINDEVFIDGADYYLPGSVFARNSRTVRPFEAYMEYSGTNAPMRFVPIFNDDADGIESIAVENTGENIYDLSGRRVNSLRPGVNIVRNGNRIVTVIIKK